MTPVWGRIALHTRPVGALLALLASSSAPFQPGATARGSGQSGCFVTLTDGDVQGTIAGAACAYSGVPYAASTAGAGHQSSSFMNATMSRWSCGVNTTNPPVTKAKKRA